ncbi:hypothetical protein [Natrinema halophilum]|uniref:hypothetical protein n=1 Tax=Natrinema halophilum TaxID=1699371 RepID=UPI001F3CC49C|nr:hypothetical protein [Natrinema halophilum]UHQ95987.1 hypothetical protein HYG82_14315 [Natrinema halophilum]
MQRMSERVSEEHVLREWLEREADCGPADADLESAPTNAAATLDALLSAKPGAAAFVWRERPIRWYRLGLDRERFVDLRPVDGPDDLLWRAVSMDGTLFGVAERVHEDGFGPLESAGIDAGTIRTYRDNLAAGTRVDPLVVRTRRGATPWFVADGNHRATAAAMRILETGRYDLVPAYVAVTANPVRRPTVDRIRGLIQRLAGRTIGHRS